MSGIGCKQHKEQPQRGCTRCGEAAYRSFAAPTGSASDYNPAECLRAEVTRFKATNTFTPMEVTGFYIQAAVVLHEHSRMVEALREIRDSQWDAGVCKKIAAAALPMSESKKTQNAGRERQP